MVLTAVYRSKFSHFSMGSFSIEYSGFIQYFILYQFEMRWVLSILYYFIVYCLWSLKSIKLLKNLKIEIIYLIQATFLMLQTKSIFLMASPRKWTNRMVDLCLNFLTWLENCLEAWTSLFSFGMMHVIGNSWTKLSF